MSYKYHRSSRDQNQKEFEDILRSVGLVVHDTSMVGGGFPDLLVEGEVRGGGLRVLFVEVKVLRKKKGGRREAALSRLERSQRKWHAECRHTENKMITGEVEDVLRWFGYQVS